MHLKVCAVDVSAEISDIALSHDEEGVFCLVTFNGRPVGDVTIRSSHRVTAELLTAKIAEELGESILRCHLEEQLLDQQSSSLPHRLRDSQGQLPTVSVIVCTRNRANDLRRCLESIQSLEYPRVEVLVVDNASDDNETYLAAMEYGAKYVREDKPGLDFARNRGIAESTGRFIAYADDDVAVSPNWLTELLRGFEDESIMCVTGLTVPMELSSEAQILFEQYGSGGFRKGYERKMFDRLNLPPSGAGRVGAGANMAFRREVFKVLGSFDEALDCGTPAMAGGDLDMFYRILAAGYRICYQPTAFVRHRHRSTIPELRRQLYGYGVAVYAFLLKCALEHGDNQAVRVGIGWFKEQVAGVAKGLVGRGDLPVSLSIYELMGSCKGLKGYMAGKSHASRMRCADGSERRCPVTSTGAITNFLRTTRRFVRRSRSWESL